MTISEVSKKFDLSTDTLRYYERIGLIHSVQRTESGLRDYSEEDCEWIAHVKCMRMAGLSVEALLLYAQLMQQGDESIPARHRLLLDQKEKLREQMALIQDAMNRLDYKIARYDEALETGKLVW